MKAAAHSPPPGFDDLDVEDQIEYVQSLWDRIAAKQSLVPIPEWHRRELERRVAAYHADASAGRSWEDVEASIRTKYAAER